MKPVLDNTNAYTYCLIFFEGIHVRTHCLSGHMFVSAADFCTLVSYQGACMVVRLASIVDARPSETATHI
jgi:hypothetical protein